MRKNVSVILAAALLCACGEPRYIIRDAVEQAYLTNYSNAIMEGNVNRAKAIKRSMCNRADTQALRAKMIFAGRNEALKYHLN